MKKPQLTRSDKNQQNKMHWRKMYIHMRLIMTGKRIKWSGHQKARPLIKPVSMKSPAVSATWCTQDSLTTEFRYDKTTN